MALASHTGWSLTEIKQMDGQELMDWLEALPKQDPHRGH